MYKLTAQGVQRLADGAFIPNDDKNQDWLEYQAWVDAGNTPAPTDTPTAPTFAQLKQLEIATWIAVREKMLARLASIARRMQDTDPTSAASCDAVATSLLGLFTDAAVVAATDIASYRAALKARYNAAIGLATLEAKIEHGKYDK